MNKNDRKRVRKLLCWCCIFSLFIPSAAAAAANIGDVYIFNDSLYFRAYGSAAMAVCGYDSSKSSSEGLDIKASYGWSDGYRGYFAVLGIEDNVFAGSQKFTYININAGKGIRIGKSAFEGVQVQGSQRGVSISAQELTEIGEAAFAGANIEGDMVIKGMCGSIRTRGFRNLKLSEGGIFTLSGKIDTLGDYSLSGMTIDVISMPAVICHMGDGVYKDTHLGRNIMPLSNSLKTIGSGVFEGTSLIGVRLPECDTVEYAADDAFEEGMLIVIPEKLEKLEVFHFDKYQNLTFQTAEGLSDDSPVIQYLKEKKLTYRKGESGEWIYPEDAVNSAGEPTETPESTATPAGISKPTAVPTEIPAESPKSTVTPTEPPVGASKPTVTPTEPPVGSSKPTVLPTEIPVETSKSPVTSTEMPVGSSKPIATSPVGVEGSTAVSTEPPVGVEGPTTVSTESPVGIEKPTVTPSAEIPTGTSEPAETPEAEPTVTPATTPDASGKTDENGIYTVGKLKYRLLGKNKVAVTGPKKKNSTGISIPGIVTINGTLYQVVRVEKQAFKGMKQLKKVKTGNNVEKIEDEAFAKCPKLKSIQFGTGLARLGKKVLYQDKNMREIIFKGTKLKKIGKKTFFGIQPKKVMIKVKKSKLKAYQKLINKAK